MRPSARLAYALSQSARMAWFTGHYLATRRLNRTRWTALRGVSSSGAPAIRTGGSRTGGPRTNGDRAARRALIRGAVDLVRRDVANMRAGHYGLPRDLLPDPAGAIGDMLRYYQDLPKARDRRQRGDATELRRAVPEGDYPDYYLRNFHYQTDGYLSEGSAALYDFQVEVLFTGTADMMRRMALVPIARFVGDHGGAEDLSLLDIACGTGGFLATLAHGWPDLALTGLDISRPYLDRAARRTKSAGGPGAAKQVSYIEANAEAVPLPDASQDIVTCIYMFHELPRAARAAVTAEIARVLRPGGRLVLADSLQLGDTPALDGPLRGFPKTFHEPYYQDYLEHDLAALFTEAGLVVRSAEPAYLSKVFTADKPR